MKSNCCNADIIENTDICSKCLDHCECKDDNGFYTNINGVETLVAYVETIEKTDYVYNLKREPVATIYNNDYKLTKVLSKLAKELEK